MSHLCFCSLKVGLGNLCGFLCFSIKISIIVFHVHVQIHDHAHAHFIGWYLFCLMMKMTKIESLILMKIDYLLSVVINFSVFVVFHVIFVSIVNLVSILIEFVSSLSFNSLSRNLLFYSKFVSDATV